MNAGKSTALLQSNYNYNERGMETLLFVPKVYADDDDWIDDNRDESDDSDDSNQITKERNKTKLEMVIDIITGKPEGKFLIYSAYDETFKPICNILRENKITFVMLKGNHNSKQAILNDYKQGDIKVIFLNSNSNSAGLNLQETTDIIFSLVTVVGLILMYKFR